jgi:hypothetical protein
MGLKYMYIMQKPQKHTAIYVYIFEMHSIVGLNAIIIKKD